MALSQQIKDKSVKEILDYDDVRTGGFKTHWGIGATDIRAIINKIPEQITSIGGKKGGNSVNLSVDLGAGCDNDDELLRNRCVECKL